MLIDLKKQIKGFALASIIGAFSIFISTYTPSWLNSILLALLIGIVLGNIIKLPAIYQSGIGFTSSKLLELSVLFLAFSINFNQLYKLGINSFLLVFIVVIAIVLFTYYFAIKVKCPEQAGWLIGFGTAICGSSAIAALSPIVAKDNKESVGISMAVVNLMGTIGMLTLPYFLLKLQFSNDDIGMVLGASLHSVGNVAGSAYSLSNEIGETAITIKLARVALLSPSLILFSFLVNKKSNNKVIQSFKLPWYLWSFIGITILGSLVSFPKPLINNMEFIGKIVLTIAMAAIGLKISLNQLMQSGRKGVLFGLIIFILQLILIFGLMKIL